MQDILSIRADRHKYYYGREKLFETHPDIVELLCKDPGAEVLLDTLFNGLLWHSNTVTQGKLRVNYYIKELYGDPEQEPNAWNSAMATLSLHAPPAVFDHPVCQMLLKSKWDTFGKKMFFGIQAFYFLILVLYYVCFVANDEMCGNNGIIRLVTGVIALLSAVVQLGLAARQWWSGLTGEFKLSYPRWLSNMPFIGQRLPAVLNIPRTLLNVFNLLRVPIYIAVAVIAFSEICVGGMTPPEHSGTLNMLASIVALVMGLQLLEVFMLQVQVASFMLVVQFLVGDVLRALLVILIVLIAFGAALGITMDVEFEGGLFDVVHKLVHLNLDMEKGLVAEGNAYSVTLVSIIVVICQVTIFNVLIAQLVSKGSGINQWTHLMVSKKFAYVCVEMESLIPMNYRIMFFKRMRFDDPLDFENGDDGPSGGIQVLEPGWIRSDPKYVPDRILRFTGDSSEKDPWPSQTINDDPHDEYD